jgi:hypothetical protein
MSNTAKTILIIVGVLVVLCVCASTALFATGLWSVGRVVQTIDRGSSEDPQDVEKIAAEIADFDLPSGYGSPYGMHFADFTSVGYASQSGNTHIFLTQFPQGTSLNVDEMLRMMKQGSVLESPWWSAEMTTTEQKPVTVRGQESMLSISEGQTSEGETFRVATVAFQGKGGGPALLIVAGPMDEWDTEPIEALIASMR